VAVGNCAYDGVYVARRGPGTVTKLNANGAVIWTSAALSGGMRAISVDNLGNIYALCDAGQIFVLDPTGALRAT